MERKTCMGLIASILVCLGAVVSANAANPVVQQLLPTSAPVGGQLVISGTGFGTTQGSSTVAVNGTPVDVIASWSATEIFAEIPIGATTGNVVVTVAGVQSNGVQLTIVPAPSITSISPNSGFIGSTITITGTNLLPSLPSQFGVAFDPIGGCAACLVKQAPTNQSDTSYTVQVPSGAVSGEVSVEYDYVRSNPLNFTVTGTVSPVADAGLNDVVPVGTTVRLDATHSYDLNGLPVTYLWSWQSLPSTSNAVLQAPNSPFATFVADVEGEYVPFLTVTNSKNVFGDAVVYIDTTNSTTFHPRPNAGPDQTVQVGATVKLDGSGSTNSKGGPLNNYLWCMWFAPNDDSEQTYQGTTSFSDPTAINPTFVASQAGSYYAALWLDGGGGCDFEPGSVTGSAAEDFVKISTVNSQPVANAGPNQSIQSAQTVQLDGTGSTDVDGNPLTYAWTLLNEPSGSTAALSSTTYPQPTFVADKLGTYVVQLIVNDGAVNSLPGLSFDPGKRTSTVTITNVDVTPVANAGPDQTVALGSLVTLDGTESSDTNGNNLAYHWSLISVPPGSTATLSLPTTANPTFTPDVAGKYVAQLIVNDGIVNSAPATVLISTDNSRPVANPGPHHAVLVGTTVQLSGAGSKDADGDPLTYRWAMLYQPSGANASLTNPTTVDPTFVASVAGLYIVQLIVNDGQLDSPPVTTWILAETQNQAPVVNAGANQTITLPVDTVTLHGTATDDGLPSGTLLINWSVVSGPGTVTFFNPNEAVTQAEFSAAGVYVLKLTANDTQLSTSATTKVTVNPPANGAPAVSAGPNQTITLPANVVSLNGSATDNGLPLTTSWSTVSGPGPVLFANASNPVTTAMFTTAGVYDLRLTANNGDTSASADATITVNPQANTPPSATILLSPASAGPNNTGTAQQMQATVTNNTGGAIASTVVTFTVTGPNHTVGTGTTNSSGIATFSYTGSNQGVDAVVATATAGSLALTSNAGMISWAQQAIGVTTSSVQGLFYTSTSGSGTFDISNPKSATPAFTETFNSLTFNPPAGSISGMPSSIGVTGPGFVNVVTNSNGSYQSSSAAAGSGLTAGEGSLSDFEAVFLGSFTVSGAGTVTFNFLNADGFVFGIGANGSGQSPSRVRGSLVNPPSSTAYNNYPVMGSFNSVTSPVQNQITVSFPAAGTYPYEIDYADSNQVALIPAGSTWKYQLANSAFNITSISRTGSTVTVTVNQEIQNFAAGENVVIAATDSTDFPLFFATLANPISEANGTTTFQIGGWSGANVSSSGGTVSLDNPTLATISSIQGSTSSNTTTITVNQALSNFAAGTSVVIAATDSTDFPTSTQTVQQVTADGFDPNLLVPAPLTTFTVPNWSQTNQSSSGGTVSLQWNLPFYEVGFNDSAFSLGQAPFTNVVGGSTGCPFIGKTLFPTFGILDLRKIVDLPPIPSSVTSLQAWVAIDNDFTLWVNGTEVTNQDHETCAEYWNWGPNGSNAAISIPSTLFVPGANLIAVQARDRGLATGFDLALVGPSNLVPAKSLTLVMSANTNNGQSSVTISPSANVSLNLGQSAAFTALVTDATGKPAANVPVTFNVAGANPQQSTIVSNASGIATFAYTGIASGTDILQAGAQVGTAQDISAQTQVSWSYLNNLPPPSGSLVLSPNTPQTQTVGNSQSFTVTATSGGVGVANVPVTLLVSVDNTQQLTQTTNSSGVATFSYSGQIAGTDTVEANAVINGTAAFSNLNAVKWNPPQPTTFIFTPQGWISSPTIGQVVPNQVPIVLQTGITLTSGTLKFFPSSNPSNVTVLNANTTGTGPLNLGVFDPTLLANGEYVIQLEAISSTGAAQLNEIVVSVTGSYKPGRQVVTATDFKVPLAGIPIAISRNYDSLNKGTIESFGNGWSFGADVNLSVDPLLNVTFTLNGNPETFYFTPQTAGQALFPWMLVPHYTPQPGVHGTLTSNGCGILIFQNNTILQDASGVACFPAGNYAPTSYTYTDPVGRAYVMACGNNCSQTPPIFQLQTITDLRGNTLTFTPTGITSSAGNVSVTFSRDSQNRITKITDPSGNQYVYTYDSPCGTGNLCGVTFPGTNIHANYTYLSDHSLNTQVDPNSNTTTYNYFPTGSANQGRLESVVGPQVAGPNGTQVQYTTQYNYCITATVPPSSTCPTSNSTFTTNPDGGIVTQVNDKFGNPLVITDALGRTTTYTYDSNENLISKTDGLGNVWTYTYDSFGNQTSVTNPLGNTSSNTYNQFAEVLTSDDPLNQNPTTYGYDSNFNLKTVTDTIGQAYAATYDIMGDPVTQTDANGNTTQFTYDSKGNLSKIVDPLNDTTSFTYDGMDRVLTTTDPRGNETVNTYDALGNLTQVTDPLHQLSHSTYDLNGNKITDTDASGRVTSYSYDTLNRLVKITYPDNTNKTYIYDFRNKKISETDQSGRITQYQYDLAGQLKSVTHAVGTADAGTTQYAYYANGLLQTLTDELGNVTTYFYDAAGRQTSVQDALHNTTKFGYDADNRRTSIIDARQNKTAYTPDARSRLLTVTYPDTTTDAYTYDGVGNRKSKTDQAKNVTQWSYDLVNRLTSVKDALANLTQYAYDPAGNLTSITDANSHVTSFQYDTLNRKVLRGLPLGMVETFSYDAVGNLSAKTDFNGKTTTFTYDKLNRLLQNIPDASLSQPTITFTYNPTGTRKSMADATGTTNYTYDNRDRLKTKATPEGTLNYTYDAHGNLLTIVSSNTNGASVTYTPDALNRLSTVTDKRMAAQGVTTPVTTYGYDPAGNLSGYTYSANGLQSTYSYDTLNRLSKVGWAKGTTSLSSFTYTPFPAGNVHTLTELSGRNVTYAYDTDYHLQTETIASDPGGNNGTESYTYDAVGNRKTLSSTIPSRAGSNSYTYDTNDRLTTDTYDKDGNTLMSLGVASTYDFQNYMLTHGSVAMVYDGDGNRVSETVGSTTTKYLVDTLNPTGYSQVMDELVGGSVTRTFAYGLRPISENQLVGTTWTPSFYGLDGHGNVRFLANKAGTVTDTYQFDAFGAQIASTGTTPNPYLYSGERFDSNLNLYHLRARYYNMLTGRFETMDPIAGRIADPRTLHKYLYVAGNPINLIDPTGQSLGEEFEIIEAEETAETEVYTNKFTCIEDAFEQLEDLEFTLSYLPEDYGASSKKSLQALLNCAKKGL